jgi:thiol-disulfide isomerase/thioredoxin
MIIRIMRIAGGGLRWLLMLICAGLMQWSLSAADTNSPSYTPTEKEFDAVARATVSLLQNRDPKSFATEMIATLEDYRAITNGSALSVDALHSARQSLEPRQRRLEASARVLVERLRSLRLDFSTNQLRATVGAPTEVCNNVEEGLQPYRYAPRLEIAIQAAPIAGEFKLAVLGLEQFPGGWRNASAIHWIALPASVVDEPVARELALLEKARQGEPLNATNQPGLRQLGERIVQFLRHPDLNFFQKELYYTRELRWAQLQKSGRAHGTRADFDKECAAREQTHFERVRAMLQIMREAQIDLRNADIQIEDASVKSSQANSSGSLDGLAGSDFTLRLAVKTDGRAQNHTPLAGEYVIAASDLIWAEAQWRVKNDFHWRRLPAGVVDKPALAAIEFDNYFAEHNRLPPGTTAPEIEFTSLTDKKAIKLSDLRGKVVVLDFWATWCGPCQATVAELQTLRREHPQWRDRVAIVSLSIDKQIDQPIAHLAKRGWTNTFNAWAGEGEWQSQTARAFRLNMIPGLYILDPAGKIAPPGQAIDVTVDNLLKEAAPSP